MKKKNKKKGKSKPAEKKNPRIKAGNHSESYALEREAKAIRKKIEETNREYRKNKTDKEEENKGTKRAKEPYIIFATWGVMLLLLVSLALTSVGTYKIDQRIQDQAIKEHVEDIIVVDGTKNLTYEKSEKRNQMPNTTGRYYGVMMESFAPVRYRHYPGEEVVLESYITIRDQVEGGKIEGEAEYEMINPEGKTVYRYSDDFKAGNNSVLKKAILLTENYKEGDYIIKFRAGFTKNKTRYMLPGTTRIQIEERPKQSFTARLGKRMTKMNQVQKLLLIVILVLNLWLIYNSWRLEREKKKIS